jgi:hypothetical protein
MIPIQKILEDQTLAGKKAHHARTCWTPSKLGACMRGLYLERLGAKPDEELDARTLNVFKLGDYCERNVIELLKQETDLEVQTQVEVRDEELDIHGFADAIVKHIPTNQIELLEIKSKNSKAFWHMKTEGAMRQHEYQAWLYMHLLRLELGSVLYVSKDDQCKLQFPVYLNDEKLAKEVLDYLGTLNKCWKEKIMPPMAARGTWQAKYCRFHKQCTKVEYEKLTNKEYENNTQEIKEDQSSSQKGKE